MQPDTTYKEIYGKMSNYELGKSKSDLTKRDSLSWRDKSWVVGLSVGNGAKAYDWNQLQRERLIHDTLDGKAVLLVLARDNRSFFAYQRPSLAHRFALRHDTLTTNRQAYTLSGKSLSGNAALVRVPAHQEFWHSWRMFHPATSRY